MPTFLTLHQGIKQVNQQRYQCHHGKEKATGQEGDDRTHRGCAAEVEHLQVKADDVHDHQHRREGLPPIDFETSHHRQHLKQCQHLRQSQDHDEELCGLFTSLHDEELIQSHHSDDYAEADDEQKPIVPCTTRLACSIVQLFLALLAVKACHASHITALRATSCRTTGAKHLIVAAEDHSWLFLSGEEARHQGKAVVSWAVGPLDANFTAVLPQETACLALAVGLPDGT